MMFQLSKISLIIFLGLLLQTAYSQDSSSGKYAFINGLKLYYEIHGSGEPLVLLHGGGSTINTTFGKILPALSSSFKIIAVEAQAHGHSGDRTTPVTFEQDADDVAALLKELKISKASIFGFSNGGSTALQLAIRHPEIINKMILASAAFSRKGLQPGFFTMMENASLGNMPQLLKEEYLKVAPDTTQLITMHNKDAARMVNFKDVNLEDIRKINAHCLVLIADHDVITPENGVKLYRLLPKSQLAIFPGVHGEYMGEITTLKPGDKNEPAALPVIISFLKNDKQ